MTDMTDTLAIFRLTDPDDIADAVGRLGNPDPDGPAVTDTLAGPVTVTAGYARDTGESLVLVRGAGVVWAVQAGGG